MNNRVMAITIVLLSLINLVVCFMSYSKATTLRRYKAMIEHHQAEVERLNKQLGYTPGAK